MLVLKLRDASHLRRLCYLGFGFGLTLYCCWHWLIYFGRSSYGFFGSALCLFGSLALGSKIAVTESTIWSPLSLWLCEASRSRDGFGFMVFSCEEVSCPEFVGGFGLIAVSACKTGGPLCQVYGHSSLSLLFFSSLRFGFLEWLWWCMLLRYALLRLCFVSAVGLYLVAVCWSVPCRLCSAPSDGIYWRLECCGVGFGLLYLLSFIYVWSGLDL